LAGAKAKKQWCKSAVGNTEELPTDLSGIVHTAINKIRAVERLIFLIALIARLIILIAR